MQKNEQQIPYSTFNQSLRALERRQQMIYYGTTDVGMLRSENQDTFGSNEINLKCIGKNALLAVVCDGMGGAAGGKVASESACDIFTKYVVRQVEAFDEDLSNPSNIPFEKILRDGVKVANKSILASAAQSEEYKGMGTTLVAVLLVDSTLYCVNIGDSRAYIINDGEISQLSHDHSYVQMLVDTKEITEDEAMYHPEKNVILKAVGVSATAEPDVFTCELPDGIILCSDGLSNMVTKEDILKEMKEEKELCDKAKALVDKANKAGGPDNITVFAILPKIPGDNADTDEDTASEKGARE